MKAWQKSIVEIPSIKLLFFSMIGAIYLELFIRGDLFKTLYWIWVHPMLFILNALAVYGVAMMIHGLFNLGRFSGISTMFLIFIFGTVNSTKFMTLGQYYYPWDNSSITQLEGISKNLLNLDFSKPVFFLVLGIAILVWLFRINYFSNSSMAMRPTQRIVALSLAVVSIGALVYHKEWKLDSGLTALGVRNYAWAPANSYRDNGSVLAYLINYRLNYIEKPLNYSKEQIATIIEEISATYNAENEIRNGQDDVKPNIIVVMSESLWDPNQLSKIQFSQNPMENLQKARKSYFVSPTFGGYTCNVEFEFLTGMTMKFLPPTSVPYQHFIKNAIPSLPSELKKDGYSTAAIHPYRPAFWARDKVYPLLGFEEFITEDAFLGAKKRGYYISDESVMDKVIGKIESSEKPLFAFAVTMQNHGPYNDNRYKETELTIKGQDPAMSEQMLDTYSQGVLEADRAFKKLTDYVKTSEEPTLVIEFGDHLPSLGDNFEMYQKYGYIREGVASYQEMTPAEQLKIRSTQLSAFSNYKDIELPAYVSPSMLTARLLDYTGTEMNAYFQMLHGLSKTFTCIYGQNVIDNNGVLGQMDIKTAEKYWSLQYDLLAGKQFYKEIEAFNDQGAFLAGEK